MPKAITCFFCFDRLKDVQSLDELGDVYNHFLLYYGRDIPKMQNATKVNKKKLKKIKEVSEEDGTAVFSLNDPIMMFNHALDKHLFFFLCVCSARGRSRGGRGRGRRGAERARSETSLPQRYVQHLPERRPWCVHPANINKT